MTSDREGRGVSQILTKGREVALIWYWQGGKGIFRQILTKGREVAWIWYWQRGRGSKIPKIEMTSFMYGPLQHVHTVMATPLPSPVDCPIFAILSVMREWASGCRSRGEKERGREELEFPRIWKLLQISPNYVTREGRREGAMQHTTRLCEISKLWGALGRGLNLWRLKNIGSIFDKWNGVPFDQNYNLKQPF